MLHGYCIRRAGEPPPEGVLGLDGAPVRLLEEAGLGLWVSDGPSSRATAGRLREHDRVVRSALRSATPLPIRYGAGGFPNEAAAREALRSRSDTLLAALDRVAGRVEMGVRVEWEPPGDGPGTPTPSDATRAEEASAPDGSGPGRAYLEARRGELARRDTLRAAAEAALARVEAGMRMEGVPTVRSVLPAPGVAGILAHLVQKSEVQRYRTCVEASGAALHDYRLTVSGPWAPYSFA